MKNPNHYGPHCAGLCEGQAYSSRIKELEGEVTKLRKRYRGSDRGVDIRTWHNAITQLEDAVNAMDSVIGYDAESALAQAISDVMTEYTNAVQDCHGLGTWLEWYWLECNMGKTPLSASIGDEPLREIATVEDLIALCAQHCENGG